MTEYHIVEQLAYDYEDSFDHDTVENLFYDSYDRLGATARVKIFLPTLAEKLTRERLDALAQA